MTAHGLLDALRLSLGHLDRFGISYALVGALAVGARSEPRFTRDIDLAVSVFSDEDAESLLGTLIQHGYTLRELFQHTETGEVVTARLTLPEFPGVLVDFLLRTSGIEPEVVREATPLELAPALTVRVARTGHLIAMKVLSRRDGRPQDDIDLKHLLLASSQEELELAWTSLALISEREWNEGRDLEAELHELRSRFLDA